jgi:hypothetical protein
VNGQSIGTPVVIISHGEKTGHLLGRLVECVQWEYPHPIEWVLNVARWHGVVALGINEELLPAKRGTQVRVARATSASLTL